MLSMRFHLTISADDYLAYYAGQARSISVKADDGRRIKFPAEHLRPFVSHGGISGYFEIEFDQNHRFLSLKRLDNGASS